MIDWWLTRDTWLMATLVAAGFFAWAVLLHWLSFHSPLSGRVQSARGIVAPFFGATALIFGLMLGFLANDVWDRTRRANRSVAVEREALTTLHALGALTDAGAKLDAAIRAYARAAVEKEWPAMEAQEAAPEAEGAVQSLLQAAGRLAMESGGSPAIDRAILDAAQRVRGAREERLGLAGQSAETVKWATVLLLALLTQVCIAVVHLDRPRPQAVALFLFATAAVSVIALVAAYEYPFDPPLNVSSAAIASVLDAVPAPPPQ